MVEINNFLSSTSYSLTFKSPDGDDIDCYIQNITHPSFNVPAAGNFSTPRRNIPLPGDKFESDSLSVSMILDEDLSIYKVFYDWMKRTVEETDTKNFNNKLVDISLLARSNKGNKTRLITYRDCFPTSLGAIQLNASDDSDAYITCDVVIDFSHFTVG